MIRIKEIFSQHAYSIFLIVFLGLLLYVPMIVSPAFGMLNDGWYITMSREVGLFDFDKLAYLHNARLIPFTLMFSDAMLTIARHTAGGLVALYALEIMTIGFAIYYLIHQHSRSKSLATLGVAFIFFSAAFVTNVYEFFTQDHISFLFILLFCIVYNKLTKESFKRTHIFLILLSIALLACFLLTKEINIFAVGIFAFMLLYDYVGSASKYTKRLDALFVLISAGFLSMYIFGASQIESMSGGYTIAHIPGAILTYGTLLHVNILVGIYALCLLFLNLKKHTWKVKETVGRMPAFYLVAAVGAFAAYLPWGASADRYLLITVGFLYIFFFSYIHVREHKKIITPLLIIVMLANLFFVAFHMVRFYGARQGDHKLLTYLQEHASEYDQICAQTAEASPEDMVELNMWVNKILKLNKPLCSVARVDSETIKEYYDEANISYNDRVTLAPKTIFIGKNYSFITPQEVREEFVIIVDAVLETHIPNIHPKRGFEIKKFDWNIGTVRSKNEKLKV